MSSLSKNLSLTKLRVGVLYRLHSFVASQRIKKAIGYRELFSSLICSNYLILRMF